VTIERYGLHRANVLRAAVIQFHASDVAFDKSN
jgi:hypothetical protein